MSTPNPHSSRDYEYTREDAMKMDNNELVKWQTCHNRRAKVLGDQMCELFDELSKDMSHKLLREEWEHVAALRRFHAKVADVLAEEIANRDV